MGIVTYGDLLRASANDGAEITVAEAGTTDLVAGHPDEQLFEAAVRMSSNDLEQLPIVDRDSGDLLGLVDLQNLMTSAMRQLEDEQVRETGKLDFGRGPL